MKKVSKVISIVMAMAIMLSMSGLIVSVSAVGEKCGKNLTYSFDKSTGTLTVSGQGGMDNFSHPEDPNSEEPFAPWEEQKNDIKSVVIDDGVTDVGAFAFDKCENLKSVKLGKDVISLERNAFSDCENLSGISFNEGLKKIEGWAFINCKALKNVEFPESLTTIGKASFMESGLTDVSVPDAVTELGPDSFAGCESLTSFRFPSEMKEIDRGIVSCCSKLTKIEFPKDVEIIGRDVFSGCDALTEIKLPDTVTEIGFSAFSNCENLAKIEFSDKVNWIGEAAFEGTAFYNDKNSWDNGVLYLNNCLIRVSEDYKGLLAVKEGTRLIGYKAFYSCSELTDVIFPASLKYSGNYLFGAECSAIWSVTYFGGDFSFEPEDFENGYKIYTIFCFKGTPVAEFAEKYHFNCRYLDGMFDQQKYEKVLKDYNVQKLEDLSGEEKADAVAKALNSEAEKNFMSGQISTDTEAKILDLLAGDSNVQSVSSDSTTKAYNPITIALAVAAAVILIAAVVVIIKKSGKAK